MTTTVSTIEDRIRQQEDKLKQLKALKQKQEARIRAAQSKKDRADDTRRKVLAGAMVLEMMKNDDAASSMFIARLNEFLTRPADRELFGLITLPDAGKSS